MMIKKAAGTAGSSVTYRLAGTVIAVISLSR
jgi:hypothetical protein